MNAVTELQGKINGIINANNYLLGVCEDDPEIAPYLQVLIDSNNGELAALKEREVQHG